MRHAVLILALLAAIPSASLGAYWRYRAPIGKFNVEYDRGTINKEILDIRMKGQNLFDIQFQPLPSRDAERLTEAAARTNAEDLKWFHRDEAWPFLFGAAGLSVFAGIVAELRRGFSAFLLLIAAAAGPAIVYPSLDLAVAAGPLLLPALLALFVRKRRPGEPTSQDRPRRTPRV